MAAIGTAIVEQPLLGAKSREVPFPDFGMLFCEWICVDLYGHTHSYGSILIYIDLYLSGVKSRDLFASRFQHLFHVCCFLRMDLYGSTHPFNTPVPRIPFPSPQIPGNPVIPPPPFCLFMT